MYQVKRARRTWGEPLRQREFAGGGMECLSFPLLERTGLVEHLFTTRLGGVSEGIFASMNLNFGRGDAPEKVRENFGRVAQALGCSPEDMVLSAQSHTTNIRLVGDEDRGKGIVKPRDYEDVDGLITNVAGIALATFYADCVPLYFVDTAGAVAKSNSKAFHGDNSTAIHGGNRKAIAEPNGFAIGLAHSGWRGTAGRMGERMVEAMGRHFGTRPENLYAAVGPSICQDCYEVGEEVAQAFWELFDGEEDLEREVAGRGCLGGTAGRCAHVVEKGKEPGKYQLDLWLANVMILVKAGIPLKQIAVTDICTCHNPEYLFSHRASGGRRGNLGAFLMLKPRGTYGDKNCKSNIN